MARTPQRPQAVTAAFFRALNRGDVRAAQALLNTLDPNLPARLGELPLAAAVRRAPMLVPRLLHHGARVDRLELGGSVAAIHAAVKQSDRGMVRRLAAAGADLNRTSKSGTPLYLAVKRRDRAMVTELLRLGADADAPVDDDGRRPWHLAARLGRRDLGDLLHAVGVELGTRTRAGWTALHFAARCRNAQRRRKTARWLRGLGIEPTAALDGTTPADLVRLFHRVEAHPAFGPPALTRAQPSRHPELEAMIQEAPEVEEIWAVYADWLAAQGDPRGGRIMLALAAQDAGPDPALTGALGAFLADARVRGDDARWRAQWRNGFLDEVSVASDADAIVPPLLVSPAAVFLRRLRVEGVRRAAVLENPGHRGLRRLGVRGYWPLDLSQLGAWFPRLEHLVIRAPLSAVASPTVIAVELMTGRRDGGPGVVELPSLRRLRVYVWSAELPPVVEHLLTRPPAMLTELALFRPTAALCAVALKPTTLRQLDALILEHPNAAVLEGLLPLAEILARGPRVEVQPDTPAAADAAQALASQVPGMVVHRVERA